MTDCLSTRLDVRIRMQTRRSSEGKSEVNVMNAAAVVVEGTVQPDGTLEVTQKVNLPAGRVHVTVQPVAEPVQPDRFWKMMESIWADSACQRANPPHSGGNRRRDRGVAQRSRRGNAGCRTSPGRMSSGQGTSPGSRGAASLMVFLDANPVIYLIEQPADSRPQDHGTSDRSAGER